MVWNMSLYLALEDVWKKLLTRFGTTHHRARTAAGFDMDTPGTRFMLLRRKRAYLPNNLNRQEKKFAHPSTHTFPQGGSPTTAGEKGGTLDHLP